MWYITTVFPVLEGFVVEFFLVAPDRLLLWDAPHDLNLLLPFAAQELERVGDDPGDFHVIAHVGVRMTKRPQIGNDDLHPVDPLLDVIQDLPEFRLAFVRNAVGLFAESEQSRGGKVQRVVDLVNNAGAHAPQGRDLFRLHQLQLGFLENSTEPFFIAAGSVVEPSNSSLSSK